MSNRLHKRPVTFVLPDIVFLERNARILQPTLETHTESAAWPPEEIDVVLARHGGTPC